MVVHDSDSSFPYLSKLLIIKFYTFDIIWSNVVKTTFWDKLDNFLVLVHICIAVKKCTHSTVLRIT